MSSFQYNGVPANKCSIFNYDTLCFCSCDISGITKSKLRFNWVEIRIIYLAPGSNKNVSSYVNAFRYCNRCIANARIITYRKHPPRII